MLGRRCASWLFPSEGFFDSVVWQALRLADPEKQGYVVRWPIRGSRFNTRNYPSTAMIIDDIETILETSLQGSLGINRREYKVSFLSGHGCAYILRITEGLLSCAGNTRLL
jgi:hypothetical protein